MFWKTITKRNYGTLQKQQRKSSLKYFFTCLNYTIFGYGCRLHKALTSNCLSALLSQNGQQSCHCDSARLINNLMSMLCVNSKTPKMSKLRSMCLRHSLGLVYLMVSYKTNHQLHETQKMSKTR